MKTYLAYSTDYLEDAVPFDTKAAAIRAFEATARELERFDQRCEAAIHLADSRDDIAEYPDFLLSLGPRGGVKCERA